MDTHSKRIDLVEQSLVRTEALAVSIKEAMEIRQENLKEKLDRLEEMMKQQSADHRAIDLKITNYIIETAQNKNYVLEKLVNKLMKDED